MLLPATPRTRRGLLHGPGRRGVQGQHLLPIDDAVHNPSPELGEVQVCHPRSLTIDARLECFETQRMRKVECPRPSRACAHSCPRSTMKPLYPSYEWQATTPAPPDPVMRWPRRHTRAPGAHPEPVSPSSPPPPLDRTAGSLSPTTWRLRHTPRPDDPQPCPRARNGHEQDPHEAMVRRANPQRRQPPRRNRDRLRQRLIPEIWNAPTDQHRQEPAPLGDAPEKGAVGPRRGEGGRGPTASGLRPRYRQRTDTPDPGIVDTAEASASHSNRSAWSQPRQCARPHDRTGASGAACRHRAPRLPGQPAVRTTHADDRTGERPRARLA